MAEDRTLESRVASLETSVGNLVTTLDRYIQSNQSQMESVFRKLDTQGRPNYPLVVSVLGFVFAILTGLGGLFVLPLRTDLQHNREWMVAADTHHREALAMESARTAKELEKLDERLQREYSLVNTEIKSRIDNANAGWMEHYERNKADIARVSHFQEQINDEGLRRVLKEPKQQEHQGKTEP
jgi:hypothetical protein